MEKKICLSFIVVLISVCQVNAQAYNSNMAVELLNDLDKGRGQLNISCWNKDYCDYYLSFSFNNAEGFEGMSSTETWTVVGPGRRQIRIYKTKQGATRYYYRMNYLAIYRGNITLKPDIDFVYALPAAVGQEVITGISGTPGEQKLIFDLPTDTVYACRDGVMCDDNLSDHSRRIFKPGDMSQITLYHNDGSFGGYIFKGKPLVAPGEKIKMGSPIAVVEKVYGTSLSFAIYFLDKEKFKTPWGNKHTNLTPFFHTVSEGKVQLKTDGTYVGELTNTLLMQDMSRHEKKVFLGNKSN